ncbi:MAG: FAD-dependent oxidoreductase [Opitutus sp.]|nr:FAD-dependent oxidoreductase [Opitutus sp.]
MGCLRLGPVFQSRSGGLHREPPAMICRTAIFGLTSPTLIVRRLIPLLLSLVTALTAAGSDRPDVVIYGATPGGIVTAVGAAREGLRVTLIHHHAHLGGMMSNGLGVLDTIYDGKRAPLFDEVCARMAEHYRKKFGADSPQYRTSTWSPRGDTRRPMYEPHVAESVFEAMLAAEKLVTVVREFHPVSTRRDGARVISATFRQMGGDATRTWEAPAFVDASYEGDLAAVAGASMTWGRESRTQYGELHAGRIFTKAIFVTAAKDYFPTAIRTEGLNLRGFRATTGAPLPGSTGAGDRAIQAYNFRVCWTRDPANRLPVSKPARYERDLYLGLRDRWGIGLGAPNAKTSWNAPLLVGGSFQYPNGDWPTRHAIAARHQDLATGLLWFLQNDPEVPDKMRAEMREWGLPKDEFTDNGGFPWEMYVREARRLVGRAVFTEHDGLAAPGIRRAPIKADSIAITEWPMDSHSCHLDTVPGSDHEGKVLLTEESRPGQISYRCLLPKEVNNLIVTGAVSSSHIGWGAIRLEPTWMHLGESAAIALALAKERKQSPADLPPDVLQRRLVARGVMLTFYNDFDLSAPTAEQRAAQYFGARGFFPSYDARLGAPLTGAVAAVWAQPHSDPMVTASRVAAAEASSDSTPVSTDEWARLTGRKNSAATSGPLSRGAACASLINADSPPK